MPRPSKYKPEHVAQAAKLCKLGATDRDLADFFGVNEASIHRWKIEFKEFANALKLGKDLADKRVEQSLYRRAMGYSHDAVKIFCSKTGEVTKVPYVEHFPPDTVACIFWLKNRKPQEWRDKLDIDATVRPLDVTAEPLKPDEWDSRYSGRPS